MIVIGISGYARAGKDTVANVLVEEHGFTKVSFADSLRQAVYVLNPRLSLDECGCHYVHYADLIDDVGYEGAKETEHAGEIRRLLQRMGTEVGRNLLGDNVWVDAAFRNLDPDGRYVFSDCRFPNEAKAIRDHGGVVWRVRRDGVGPANDHPSETSLDTYVFNAYIYNDGTIEDLSGAVETCLRAHRVLA